MGSSAFLLPIEPRGLYREMLSQSWRRGARLPNDHGAIQRAVGCSVEEWARAWPQIERYWRVEGDSLVNDTQLEVYGEAMARYEAASARGRKGAAAMWAKRGQPREKPAKPEPVKGQRWRFLNLYISPKMHAIVSGSLGKRAEGLDWDKFYNAAACDYAERGEPADKIADLKQRARAAVEGRREVAPDVDATRKRHEAEDASAPDAAEREKIRQMFKSGAMRKPLSLRA
jgi:uncharacterized protein YdaU (DUF1376 family)